MAVVGRVDPQDLLYGREPRRDRLQLVEQTARPPEIHHASLRLRVLGMLIWLHHGSVIGDDPSVAGVVPQVALMEHEARRHPHTPLVARRILPRRRQPSDRAPSRRHKPRATSGGPPAPKRAAKSG